MREVPAYETVSAHLWKHLDEWFTFLSHPEIEPTNWEAERAIRPAVVNRKVWGGNRTWVGAHAQEVLMSVLETCRRAGRSGLEFVSRTLCAFGDPRLPRPILLTPRYVGYSCLAAPSNLWIPFEGSREKTLLRQSPFDATKKFPSSGRTAQGLGASIYYLYVDPSASNKRSGGLDLACRKAPSHRYRA